VQWGNILPEGVADRHSKWEQRHSFLRAYEAGATQTEIAERIGVTPARVQQLVTKAREEVKSGARSPAERFLQPFVDH
jgi:transcriptional regulator